MNSIIPILRVKKLRQREFRNWLVVITLETAAPGFEPRQSNSSTVYSFFSPTQWWMSPGKSSVSEVGKLALPFINWPFNMERVLTFPLCKMRTGWVMGCPLRVLHVKVLRELLRACVLSCFSPVRLFATPWTVALQASLSMEFSGPEYWSGWSCPPPGDFTDPGIKLPSLASPALSGEFFITSTTWVVPLWAVNTKQRLE